MINDSEMIAGMLATVVFLGFIFGSMLSFIVIIPNITLHYQQEAIKYGYAQYDAKTGEWEWKNSQTLNTEP